MRCALLRKKRAGSGRPHGSALERAGLALCCLAVLAAAGCGSAERPEAPAEPGRVAVTIRWPEASRLIPLACNSIRIEVTRASTVLASQVVDRPGAGGTSAVAFENLAVGLKTVKATAYPQAGAAGTAQATGSVNVTVVSGQTVSAAITMGSTVDRLEVSPASPSVVEGQSVTLTVTARNAAGSIVLVAPSAYRCTSGNTAIATVTDAGVVTGVAPGTVTVTVRDTESSKFIAVPVLVTSALTITPAAAGLVIGTTQQFTVSVAGLDNQAVRWSVQEAGGGTITQTGLYKAPNVPGSYHVVVRSEADATKSATAPVTVVEVPTVTIGPTSATVSVRGTVQFAAAVNGVADEAVTWSVQEPGGGSVSDTGLYTAPASPGTYHVTVASKVYPNSTATATVVVQAGNISGTIQ